MRVSIDTEEKAKGLVFKTTYYYVNVSVIFSEEENATISQRKLKDYIVLEREWDAEKGPKFANDPKWMEIGQHLRIRTLTAGTDSYACVDPVRAKEYEQKVVEALKNLKNFFEQARDVGESKTFEL